MVIEGELDNYGSRHKLQDSSFATSSSIKHSVDLYIL